MILVLHHVKGIKKQGGLLIEDGKSQNIVIDIDGEIPADKIAAVAFKIDPKLIPFLYLLACCYSYNFHHMHCETISLQCVLVGKAHKRTSQMHAEHGLYAG